MENQEEVVQQALNEGIVVYDKENLRFECHLCQKPMTGIISVAQHLANKKHEETCARYAISHLQDAPESLLRLLPPVVKIAAEEGTIQVAELSVGTPGLLCRVCDKVLTGMAPIKQHLVGNDHRKKINVRQLVSPVRHPVASGNNLNQALNRNSVEPSSTSNTVQTAPVITNTSTRQLSPQVDNRFQNSASPTSFNTLTQQALNDQVLTYDNASMRYKCQVCNIPLSGDSLLIDHHLKNKVHTEEGARYAIQHPEDAPQSLLDLLPQDAIEAAKAGIIVITGDKAFQCKACYKFFTGMVPLKQHLVSSDHLKKTSNPPEQHVVSPRVVNEQHQNTETLLVHNWSPDILTPPALMNENIIDDLAKAFEEGVAVCIDNASDKTMCTVCRITLNGSKNLQDHLNGIKHKKKLQKKRNVMEEPPSVVETKSTEDPNNSTNSVESTHRAKASYSMTSEPRGHVHIFNYMFTGQTNHRRGAEHDSANLMTTFSNMGYMVFCHENLTSDETKSKLEEITQDETLKQVDALILFFLSHGTHPYTFFANDGKPLDLHTIWYEFTDTKCPSMKKKPKIFFTNYCRGKDAELPEYDAVIDIPRDMVTIHASHEEITALRSPKYGTHFIKSLCEILEKHAKEFDLRELYQELDYVVKGRGGRQPKWEDTRFKKFYFKPVL